MRGEPWFRRVVPGISAVAAMVAAIALGALVSAPAAFAQVSPGPLAKAHGSLEGNRQCFQCHPPAGSSERMDDRCLACHQEIAALREAKRGLHARVADEKCAKCHPDHGGADFDLVAFAEGSPAKFDHARAGYALEGAHAKVECRSCHQPSHQRGAVVAKMKRKDHAASWLGLETACASCHGDAHRGQLSLQCERCHTPAAWKPATRFDHAKTAYPLTGKHATLECAKCHTTEAEPAKGVSPVHWKPVAHGECSSCHKDPHAGRFGAACAKCHTTSDFHRISSENFDHSRTRYPLAGAHAAVACAKCHDPVKAWGAKPAFDRCDRCHRDAHGGQTAKAGAAAPDCAVCHDVKRFRPSIFSVADHARTGYALQGAHARADCTGCHGKSSGAAAASFGTARVPLHPEHAECTSCHGDPHGGRFSRGGDRPRNEGCIGCHDMEHFSPSRVDAAFHAGFRYALEGAHRAVPCVACHRELQGRARLTGRQTLKGTKLAALAFRDDRRRCAQCHESPHGKQFASRRDHGACESCHGLASFTPASRFDHGRDTSFKLEGGHAKIACAACHPSVKGARGPMVVYRPVSTRCESCHATR